MICCQIVANAHICIFLTIYRLFSPLLFLRNCDTIHLKPFNRTSILQNCLKMSSTDSLLSELRNIHGGYTNTALGRSLRDALDELIEEGSMSNDLAERVMKGFENMMTDTDFDTDKSFLTIDGHIRDCKCIDNNWIIWVDDCRLSDGDFVFDSRCAKILALDARPKKSIKRNAAKKGLRQGKEVRRPKQDES
ncbi:hypothetical protein ACOME3_004598 [Neoechinorhynchus agilis]